MTMRSTEPGFRRVLQLPDGIMLEAVLPPMEDRSRSGRSPAPANPDAGRLLPGIGIQLVNRHGTRRLIRLDP